MTLSGKWLVTGGAGFLARGIYRRARVEQWDAQFTCLSRDDAKHAALQRRFPEVDTVIADVGLAPVDYLTALMRGFDGVIHAAASKYVDRAEHFARATIETNVVGSMHVAEAAMRARVPQVIGISTDKAVAPVNNYGATKFLMERTFQEADRLSDTKFTLVRYGNVVASTGSVIQSFMQAVREEKPIRLTDPAMTRFWMSADEAVDTVLAGLAAPGGMVVIPRCRSMRMDDLALMALGYPGHDLLPTSDVPGPDRGRVEIIGVRPGEKRHEALLQRSESVRARGMKAGGIASYSDWQWLYLAPPDTQPNEGATEFEVMSNAPPGGWIGFDEMRAIVADAEAV